MSMQILSSEEIGHDPKNRLFRMLLLNPHDHHFWYQRPDGTLYGYSHIKDHDPEDWYWEVDGYQLELQL